MIKSFKEYYNTVNEKSYKVDNYENIDIKFDITISDGENDLTSFKGDGTILDVHEFGTTTPYQHKGNDDSIDDTETSYDDATFEVSKETEKKITDWLVSNGYTEDDRDYVELDFSKQKVDLQITAKKI
jgi:hypothetical protein